jgi:hypothetical protein
LDLQTLGNLGDFVGGVAVIVSLLYLAVQIRQNTRMLKASALAAVTDAYISFNRLLGSDPAVARVFQVGLEDFASLAEDEKRQFLNLLRAAFAGYEHVFQNFRGGLIEPEVWQRIVRDGTLLLARPHIRIWWEARKSVYTESFVRALEQAPAPASPPLADEVIRAMSQSASSAPGKRNHG